ncbi:hypothetical protein DAI22_01g325700 [Oryza sativa Japonica Group]|nr:hypothetical protein DAI22_01g325700 [Oryza sativa Japonica Group]
MISRPRRIPSREVAATTLKLMTKTPPPAKATGAAPARAPPTGSFAARARARVSRVATEASAAGGDKRPRFHITALCSRTDERWVPRRREAAARNLRELREGVDEMRRKLRARVLRSVRGSASRGRHPLSRPPGLGRFVP